MLYTKKGDSGTTKLWDSDNGLRISKGELVFEALGTVDELNSALGYAKVLCRKNNKSILIKGEKVTYEYLIEKIQLILFSVQAELGGAQIHTKEDHVKYLEDVLFEVETILPPLHSFVVYGGGEVGAYLDLVRAIARRSERLVVAVAEEGNRVVSSETIKFLNRLSSALYGLARYANYEEGYVEKKPDYK